MEPENVVKKSNIALSTVLRIGLVSSLLCIISGAGLFLWECAQCTPDYKEFYGEPGHLTKINEIFLYALQGNSLGIVQLGILLLIATPILRVITCIAMFAEERDHLYIVLALVVLLVLLYGFL